MQSPILVIGSKEKEEKEKEKKEEVEKNIQIAFRLLKGLPRPSG